MPAQSKPMSWGIEVTVRAQQTHRRELLQTLEDLRDRLMDGASDCVCDFFEDLSEPNRFMWTEWWVEPEKIDEVMKSRRFRTLLGAVKVLGTLESVRRVDRSAEPSRETTNDLN